MSVQVRCDCCGRRRGLWKVVPVEVSRDIDSSGVLVVCGDRAGCRNLDVPVAAVEKGENG